MPTLSRHLVSVLYLLAAVVAPPTLTAQEDDSGLRGYLEAAASGTRVHGESAGAFRLAAGLELGPRFRIGGRGTLLDGAVDVGRVGFQDLEVELGYGGLAGTLIPATDGRWDLFTTIFVGAGNVDVRDRATGIALDADNFLVVEAEGGAERRLRGALSVFLSASYRWSAGVEDLPGVSGADLRGPSLTAGLRISAR